MSQVDRAVAQLAARQHAVVSVRQAEELGLTRSMRRTRIGAGVLIDVRRGVLRIAGAPMTFESVVLAAVLSAGRGAVASHRTAAALWELDGYRRGVIELTIPRGRKHRPGPSAIAHESSDLDRVRPRTLGSIPVTDPSRTLLDVALRSSDRRLLTAIESGRRSRLTSWPEMIETLLLHARRGRPGIQRLRRVLAANIDREEVTDSGFEALVLALLAEHALPKPVLHHQIGDGDGRVLAIVDLAYPARRIAIELDGRIHLRPDVWERDRPRQNQLELLGWTVLRFTWNTYAERPQQLIAEISRALAARR
jgi:hypothetical protein